MNMNELSANTKSDPIQVLLDSPLSRFQKIAIFISIMLYALDGFDVLAVTYAAPGFLAEWQLSRSELGLALSTGLAGMALGSFILAPVADLYGRRPMIVACLVVMAVGMLASATSQSLMQLASWRLLTGLGIGGMISIVNPLGAEYANRKNRNFVIGLMAVGFPIGGTLGGLIASFLLEHYDWRSIFIFGGICSLIMLPIIYFWLLEPVALLINKPRKDSLERVNVFMERCGHEPVSYLPIPQKTDASFPFMDLFGPVQKTKTLHIAVLYSLYMITVYFFLSWAPQLIVDHGFEQSDAAKTTVSRDLAGVLGGICLGYLARQLPLKIVTLTVLPLFAVAVVLFSKASSLMLLHIISAVAGFMLYAGMVGLNALVVRTFPVQIRASGTGFVIGTGRIVSGGTLFSLNFNRTEVCIALSLFAIASTFALIRFNPDTNSSES